MGIIASPEHVATTGRHRSWVYHRFRVSWPKSTTGYPLGADPEEDIQLYDTQLYGVAHNPELALSSGRALGGLEGPRPSPAD